MRYVILDMLKAVAIIGLAIEHIRFNLYDYPGSFFIRTIFLGIFFLVAGYLFRPNKYSSFKDMFKSKMFRLLFPALPVIFLYYFIGSIAHLWFIVILILFYCIFYFIGSKRVAYILSLLSIASLYFYEVGVFNPLGDLYFMVFFFLGFYLRRDNYLRMFLIRNNKNSFLSFIGRYTYPIYLYHIPVIDIIRVIT
jgi:hypothetical protein